MKQAIIDWIIKVAISNSGKVVRLGVGAVIAVLVKDKIIPNGDVTQIQTGLEQGGYALAAIAYALFEFYVNANHPGPQSKQ